MSSYLAAYILKTTAHEYDNNIRLWGAYLCNVHNIHIYVHIYLNHIWINALHVLEICIWHTHIVVTLYGTWNDNVKELYIRWADCNCTQGMHKRFALYVIYCISFTCALSSSCVRLNIYINKYKPRIRSSTIYTSQVHMLCYYRLCIRRIYLSSYAGRIIL